MRWAAIVFALVVISAIPLIVHQGRDQWFFLDEWVFIVNQDFGADYLLSPHNEHLVLLPRLIYGVLYRLVGLGAYWPYQLVVIGAHLLAAVLLWVVMRRGGVRPWVATAVASTFVVLGSGRHNIVWAFQIAFTGALAFGLAQLLLADHDGPLQRRDAGGLACGLGSILCSTVGVFMVGVVGLSLALRRRWLAAAFHVLPLAMIWSAWVLTKGRGAYTPASPRAAFDFVTAGISHAFAQLVQVSGVGVVLGMALVAGLVLAMRSEGVAPFVRRAALPLALVVGGWAFLAVTGFARAGRIGSNDMPQATRYVYLTVAMFLPVLAVAIDQLANRTRGAAIAACVALAVGVPGNVAALRASGREAYMLGRENVVLVAAHLPEMEQVPANLSPFRGMEALITAGWLRRAVSEGRAPDRHVSPVTRANIALEVTLHALAGSPRKGTCPTLEGPVNVAMERGQEILFGGGALQTQLRYGDVLSDPATFPATGSQRIMATAGPLDLVVGGVGGSAVEVCLPGDARSTRESKANQP